MTIATWLTGLLAGPLAETLTSIIRDARQRKLGEAEIRAEVERAIAATIEHIAATKLAARRQVLLAELNGESRLQRLWRPVVALSFASVLMFYALLLPVAVDWFGLPPVRVGDALLGWVMTSVNIALGGYIGGRTLEKVALLLRRS